MTAKPSQPAPLHAAQQPDDAQMDEDLSQPYAGKIVETIAAYGTADQPADEPDAWPLAHVLHLLRNPHGHSDDEMRAVRQYAADWIEKRAAPAAPPSTPREPGMGSRK